MTEEQPRSPIRRRDTPVATLIALTIAVLIAGALLANAVLGYAWSIENRTRRTHGEAVAGQVAAALMTYIATLQAQADRLARDMPATGPDADPARLEQDTGVPGFESIQFVELGALGIASPDFDPGKLRGNIEVDLVGETFKGTRVAGEAVDDGERWLLVVGARVPGGDGARGVLLLRARIDAVLAKLLVPANPQGEYSILTRPGGGPGRAIASGGIAPAADAESYIAPTPLPALHAGFRPAESSLAATAISGMMLLMSVLGGTAILVILVLFGLRQLQRQLREDADRLSDAALYQRAATASVPPLHYTELVGLGEAIVRMRRERIESTRRVRDDSNQAPLAEADALQIEIIDDQAAEAEIQFATEPELAVPAEIFRDYDIRAHSQQLDHELVYSIGRAIGTEALERDCSSIVVGADGRTTSPMLREQLVQGLLASGIDVVDVGTVATPMLYFACHHLGTQTGVMVTGSHNPPGDNGFKIMLAGESLCGERITALRTRILEERYREGQGGYRVTEINADYLRAVCDDVLVDKPLKLVVDCGNGAASVIAVELLQELGCEVVPLFCELDGRFPNHPADPSVPANLRQLVSEVAAQHAELGIAFDGDGDRIGIVTASGRIVAADRLLMLFAGELLSRHPGADIVFDVKCSRDLATVIARHGGRPIMWRSGHSWIKEKMKETGALLGGEFTGHVCFKDRWFGFDDALYCAARLLEILSAEQKSLDELLAALPQSIGTPEIRVPVPEERKFALMGTLAEGISLDGARLTRIDGVRAEYSDGWGLVRASNTAAALVLRFEAQNERALARIQDAFRTEIARLLPGVALPS